MKDIDFDELDRAVSSVLGGATPKPDGTIASSAPVVAADTDADGMTDTVATISSNNVVEQQPDASSVTPITQQERPSIRQTTPLAVKRRGKFMDVVHPSSDMNPASNSAPVMRKSITPLTSVVPEEPVAVESEQVSADVSYDTGVASDDTGSNLQDDSSLSIENSTSTAEESLADIAAQKDSSLEGVETSESVALNEPEAPAIDSEESSSTVDAEQQRNDISVESDDTATDSSHEMNDTEPTDTDAVEPLAAGDGFGPGVASTPETPFLTDAKVEKRPLGGFGDAESSNPDETLSEAGSLQSPPPVSLPRELQADVVSVESIQDDTKSPAETAQTATAPVLSTVPVADDSDSNTHSLFDTSSYHEPISHEKKSSVPAWVWWLVGLMLCLGAGAGVGYLLFITGL